MSSGTPFCTLANHNVLLDSSDKHAGWVPCENISILLGPKQKKHSTCIQDATGVSGKGYKHEREYIKKMRIPLAVEEQAL